MSRSSMPAGHAIKLFLTDIDGCLAEPYEGYDLERIGKLREWVHGAENDERIPTLGICSGRSYAYVEAVSQALDLRGPALFESGGGRFDLQPARIRWSAALTPEIEAQLDAVRRFLLTEIVPLGSFSLDYGKRAQAGVVTKDADKLAEGLERTRRHVDESYPDLIVADTNVSIDVLPRSLTKREAIKEVADEEGLELQEIAFIGDTGGDIGGLEVVGKSFAPKNAQSIVKEVVDVVTPSSTIEGVIEAFHACLDHNNRLIEMS